MQCAYDNLTRGFISTLYHDLRTDDLVIVEDLPGLLGDYVFLLEYNRAFAIVLVLWILGQ